MRLIESAAPDGPLETVVPSYLHGRVSSPHREETPTEGSLDPGLSIDPLSPPFRDPHVNRNAVLAHTHPAKPKRFDRGDFG